MSQPIIRQIVITLAGCLLTAVIVLLLVHHVNKRIAVVDAIKVFNAYKMKQELEGKAGVQLKYLAHEADSIKTELSVKSKAKNIPEKELQDLYQSFQKAQMNVEQEYQASNQMINEQVWKRLNPAIDEYAKKEGFRLIIGANGRGSVLYFNDFYDKTQEVIDFVNKKYEEGN